jgi:uncharacterized protein YkwD
MYKAHPRRLLVLLFLCTCVLLSAAPVIAQSGPDPERSRYIIHLPLVLHPSTLDPVELEVVNLTNQFRAENSCPPLTISNELMAAARSHSQGMALGDYFDHTDPAGHDPEWRAEQAGYTGNAGWENIAAGYETASAVVEGWKDSAGHRANMLNCSLTDIGVGHIYIADDPGAINYHDYWTQTFGHP